MYVARSPPSYLEQFGEVITSSGRGDPRTELIRSGQLQCRPKESWTQRRPSGRLGERPIEFVEFCSRPTTLCFRRWGEKEEDWRG